MKLTQLRIVGFKSFVEPTEVSIEPGLTGVVGPNGCGKSNLVEALRWVMGESSHKNMRASGMDDVIFSGSANRPARNTAEVVLTVDNGERRAPSAFNEFEVLEIGRRIEREAGSTYRINGREVRARDVQLLFADAATGARSPALVRQGQISEIIAAKPQARRRIIEDAAGIAGLHARRHEAELRLKAAEDNLVRVEDVLRELDAQVESLRRQGRQAARYRTVSAEIRRLEAVLLALAYAQAREHAAAAERQAQEDLAAVADRTREQAEAATAQAVAAHALPPLREAEVAAAAALQRLVHARNELEAEERRAKERITELERRIAEIERDIAREAAGEADAAATIARLEAEAAELAKDDGDAAAKAEAEARLAAAEQELRRVEDESAALQAQVADLNARRAALERTRREEGERTARFAEEWRRVERDLSALAERRSGPGVEALRAAFAVAEEGLARADERAGAARAALAAARDAEARARGPLAEADKAAQRLETEGRTLARMFAPAAGQLWPPALDQIGVDKGFEVALGAALGDDLDASTEISAPAHWADTGPGADDPPLPEGVPSLADGARTTSALTRRLRQIGIVPRAEGARLREALRPGQRLVSREGDLWRWDGFSAAAEAPSAAARRLAERNRLGEVEAAAAAARKSAEARRGEAPGGFFEGRAPGGGLGLAPLGFSQTLAGLVEGAPGGAAGVEGGRLLGCGGAGGRLRRLGLAAARLGSLAGGGGRGLDLAEAVLLGEAAGGGARGLGRGRKAVPAPQVALAGDEP
ncbi:MAG TPA: chromosome segregation SMC family protein, partial [Beijerinckiaceae bacterium]|nr:chromosome segregation SMC family protein [Beijerinckiaceae bacterium]